MLNIKERNYNIIQIYKNRQLKKKNANKQHLKKIVKLSKTFNKNNIWLIIVKHIERNKENL